MASGLTAPHLLLASKNPMKMIENLRHLLAQRELSKLVAELDRNVTGLYALGMTHFNFASSLSNADWRQKISRLYYGVYNVRRAVVLKHSGSYSTDSSDHKNIESLPDNISNRESHIGNLRNLREDRNLADYNHQSEVSDLIIAPDDALSFATEFVRDSKQFLFDQGLAL